MMINPSKCLLDLFLDKIFYLNTLKCSFSYLIKLFNLLIVSYRLYRMIFKIKLKFLMIYSFSIFKNLDALIST